MDSLKSQDLSQILGLYSPWSIKNIELADAADSITIHLEKQPDRSRFSFLAGQKRNQQVTRRWQHVRFGHVNSFIEATMSLEELAELSDEHPPAFLGAENKAITHELADTIRLAHSRNLSADMISGLLGLAPDVVETELREIETEELQKRNISLLPLESNPVWRNILTDKVKLSTRLLPLKLLLSRLKLQVSKNMDRPDVMQKSIAELRSFFLRHAHQLTHEYAQIGAHEQSPTQRPMKSGKTKLVLPGTRNIIWQQLLSGQFELPTNSMPLKLNLAQQRRAFATASTESEKLDIIRTLQLFFKHNARTLIPELKLLTQMLQEQQSENIQLPPVNHTIWKQLLLDDKLLNTDKINYRLLLSRLKTSYRRNQDTGSIEQLHHFFSQNARAMTEEIKTINNLAAAQ